MEEIYRKIKQKIGEMKKDDVDVQPYPIQYPVILVHGYLSGPKCWDFYIPWFEEQGYEIGKTLFVIDLAPGDELADGDIKEYATRLSDFIESDVFGENLKVSSQKIDIVGHSMGGLVARWYIEKLEGNTRVNKLVMLGTPNRGSKYLPQVKKVADLLNNGYNWFRYSYWEEWKLKAREKIKGNNETKNKKLSEESQWEEDIEAENISEAIKQIQSIDSETLGKAAEQMLPNSEFLRDLGYQAKDNYYTIAGTKGIAFNFKGENDLAVTVESVELDGMPLNRRARFYTNHFGLHNKPIVFKKVVEFLHDIYSEKKDISTKEKIVESTFKIIAERKSLKFSLNDVAKHSDTSIANVRYYFGTREKLLEHIGLDYIKNLYSIYAILEREDLKYEESLERWANDFIQLQLAYPGMMSVFSHNKIPGPDEKLDLQIFMSQTQEILNEVITEFCEQAQKNREEKGQNMVASRKQKIHINSTQFVSSIFFPFIFPNNIEKTLNINLRDPEVRKSYVKKTLKNMIDWDQV